MLTTSKKTQYSYLRRVCALPILMLVTIMLSFKIVNAQTDPQLKLHDPVKVDNNVKLQLHDSIRIDNNVKLQLHDPVKADNELKLQLHDSLKIDKISIQERNDSVADVAINYTEKGKSNILNLTAGYSKKDSSKTNILYDQESGERREVSIAETNEIVKQIIQNPPAEDAYFVDGNAYSPEEIRKLDPAKIKTINVYNKAAALKRFGDKAKNGAIVFTTK